VEVVSLEVEAEGAAGFVLAMDADQVLGVELGGDGCGELPGSERRGEGLEREVRGEEEEEAGGEEGEVGGVGFGPAAQQNGDERAEEERER
jgi:hypothetical protein